MNKKTTGFIARCQCGEIIGAMDYSCTDRRQAGKILEKWLVDGCIVEPRFGGCWSVIITQCKCDMEKE